MSPTWRVLVGDVREKLSELPDRSVQCCVTSPPYWGLRDYGTATWDGGDSECDHLGPPMRTNNKPSNSSATFHGGTSRSTEPWKNGICGKCGARRIDSQLGLEPTPDAYVQNMVAVFAEVRRVLKDDGTVWLNLGDSYNAYNGGAGPGSKLSKTQTEQRPQLATGYGLQCKTLKPKDLCGIPWRVAFALQADGWWLRSDIIWAKPNPMPESVTDRPTRSHEYVFLLTKSARYYYDAEAIAEPLSDVTLNDSRVGRATSSGGTKNYAAAGAQNPCDVRMRIHNNLGTTRNCRSVWQITTQPYPDAHFATFPEALPERCIKAGSAVGDTILDPFCGSGTTGQVAIQLGRSFLGIELNPEYAELSRRRINQAAPLFASEASA